MTGLRLSSALMGALMVSVATQAPAASPLSLDFLPPQIDAAGVCLPPEPEPEPVDLEVEGGQDELTDPQRLLYLKSDIRALLRRDADRYFDFIDRLIDMRATLDPDFVGADEILARITLHLRAGRLDDLHLRGLVHQLRDQVGSLTNVQRVELARYYTAGIGVEEDLDFAAYLIREAALGGNPEALLEIARQQIRGVPVSDWDAPLDLTVTLAFGGILGGLDGEICRRAERIAQEYLKGEIVARNEAIALAWRRFAADLGSGEAAWRIVDYHLSAEAAEKDNEELKFYLARATELGFFADGEQLGQIAATGAVSPEEVEAILGFNHSNEGPRAAHSVIPYLRLTVNIDGLMPDEDGPYLQYLRELATLPEAPGLVFTRLAKEVLVKRGRWAAEAEAIELLERAVALGDGEGMQLLAQVLTRYRDDPAQVNRVENLLLETVDRFGMASSMQRLDRLYRCQVNDAPRLDAAMRWAERYGATRHALVRISATDLLALDPFKDPETIAQIQSQALSGRTQSLAAHGQRMQAQPAPPADALAYWADRIDNSDQALEAFAELEFALATTPAERAQAVEFFRRVYLNNGVTTALDLAIALLEDFGRDPDVADEILHLLTMAGNRGEGAAIRLKSRLLATDLTARAYSESAARVYAEFADAIEDRGDFLAMMFAVPHIPAERVDDYVDRAVSLMNCGTKDADELGDAYALREDPLLSYHWRRIALQFDGGHVLSKLRLTDAQMSFFADGRPPSPDEIQVRALEDGSAEARRGLFALTANPDLPSYDPDTAASAFSTLLASAAPGEEDELLALYREAPFAVRQAVGRQGDMRALLRRAAATGDADVHFALAMLLREEAAGPEALADSVALLRSAAEAGHAEAMVELGFALGFGVGVEPALGAALEWLARAEASGAARATELSALLRAARQG